MKLKIKRNIEYNLKMLTKVITLVITTASKESCCRAVLVETYFHQFLMLCQLCDECSLLGEERVSLLHKKSNLFFLLYRENHSPIFSYFLWHKNSSKI